MNRFMTYFNYNWFSIIKKNIKNNKPKQIEKKELKKLSKLVLTKEICALIFTIINFLITYTGSIEIYKLNYENNIFLNILKDNFLITIIWFVTLTILPVITIIMAQKKLKTKYYLLLSILYLFSNLYNVLMIMYFIISFVNGIILGLLGIINIIITIIINANIIININENYLINK